MLDEKSVCILQLAEEVHFWSVFEFSIDAIWLYDRTVTDFITFQINVSILKMYSYISGDAVWLCFVCEFMEEVTAQKCQIWKTSSVKCLRQSLYCNILTDSDVDQLWTVTLVETFPWVRRYFDQ